MQLKDFIKTALIEIAEAVKEADLEYAKMGGAVNPQNVYGEGNYTYTNKQKVVKVSDIEFNLVVSESHEKGSEKGGGLNLKVLSAKLGDSKASSQSIVNTIKFSIPLVLPVNKENKNTERRQVYVG